MNEQVDVLVVDDHEAIRISWSVILGRVGWRVEEATDGLAALDILRATPVGVMVLDVRMPGLGGFELLDLLDNPPPVILAPACSYDTEVMARRDKIHSVMLKPIRPDRLIATVAAALEEGGGGHRGSVPPDGTRCPSTQVIDHGVLVCELGEGHEGRHLARLHPPDAQPSLRWQELLFDDG